MSHWRQFTLARLPLVLQFIPYSVKDIRDRATEPSLMRNRVSGGLWRWSRGQDWCSVSWRSVGRLSVPNKGVEEHAVWAGCSLGRTLVPWDELASTEFLLGIWMAHGGSQALQRGSDSLSTLREYARLRAFYLNPAQRRWEEMGGGRQENHCFIQLKS